MSEPIKYRVNLDLPEGTAERVLAWFIAKRSPPPPKPVSIRTKLREHKAQFEQCQACLFRPGPDERGRALHVHHVVPRAKGGTHDRGNLLVLCARCHARAHALMKKRPPHTERLLFRLMVMAARDEA